MPFVTEVTEAATGVNKVAALSPETLLKKRLLK